MAGVARAALFGEGDTLTPGEELVVQRIVSWHPGCGGGSAWVKWGVDAIAQYKHTNGYVADLLADDLRQLWGSKDLKDTKLLSHKSSAGDELLRCAVYFIGHQRHKPLPFTPDVTVDHIRPLSGHARLWAREVSGLIEALYELPDQAIQLVREAAGKRGLHLPATINLQRPNDLVDAATAILCLEHAIHTASWPLIKGTSLELPEARRAVEFALHLANHPGSRSGRDIAFKSLAYDFNPQAFDGFELELGALRILHTPSDASPMRPQVRDRMIGIIESVLRKAVPSRVPPKAAFTAARVLAGIGDDLAVAKMVEWLADYPTIAADMFPPQLFEQCGYELDPRGRRRDLLLGYTISLADAPAPDSPQRRDQVEILRPIGGKCQACGGKMLALFDVLLDPQVHLHFPNAWRVFLPLCVRCAHSLEGYSSRLRLDERRDHDVDAWPVSEVASLEYGVPARRFRALLDSPVKRSQAWLGGIPHWEQEASWPHCERCRRGMVFVGQASGGPVYYGFFCPDCLTSNVRVQYD